MDTLEKHGKNYRVVEYLIPGKTRAQIDSHGAYILMQIRANPDHPYAHLEGVLAKHVRWKSEEHERFMEAVKMFGNDLGRISQHVGTRNKQQCRSHALWINRSHPDYDEIKCRLPKKRAATYMRTEWSSEEHELFMQCFK